MYKVYITSVSMIMSVAISSNAYASVSNNQLKDVYISGNKEPHKNDKDVTGLGKIVKNTDSLNKEMVSSIRDLTRYDPGVSVVEQGSGATVGYSIRGMDKNRVGVTVDGIPQVQSYVTEKNNAISGAINDVEYEHISSVEISKGASSSEFGSGALGGSVQFKTKEASDIIKPNQDWGVDTKNAYNSKNNLWTNSIALAGAYKDVDALAVVTKRSGNEVKGHTDYSNKDMTLSKVGVLEKCGSVYTWFKKPDGSLHKSLRLTMNKKTMKNYSIRQGVFEKSCGDLYKSEEEYRKALAHRKEKVKAADYTGKDRLLPNKLDYDSGSALIKLGYHLTPKTYMVGIYENTKQDYDIRDMTLAAHWHPDDVFDTTGSKIQDKSMVGYVSTKHPFENIRIIDSLNNVKDKSLVVYNPDITTLPIGSGKEVPYTGRGLRWTRTRFIEEAHNKQRVGFKIGSKQVSVGDTFVLDEVMLGINQQNINLLHTEHEHNCSVYPIVDKKCRASVDKPWSFYRTQSSEYEEKHTNVNLDIKKNFKTSKVKHKVTGSIGYDKFASSVKRYDWFAENAILWNFTKTENNNGGSGSKSNPYMLDKTYTIMATRNYCGDDTIVSHNCTPSLIEGYNQFISLRDNISFNKKLKFGAGIRYDKHKFSSKTPWVRQGDYDTLSWNTGVVVKPITNVALSYRLSNGFRVPSFREHYGQRSDMLDEDQKKKNYANRIKLKPEKAINHEIAVGLNHDLGAFEISYYKNKYTDLIASAAKRDLYHQKNDYNTLYNVQDVDLEGINVTATADFNSISDTMPEGLYGTVAYNRVQPTHSKIKDGYIYVDTPLLDAIQPARTVVGLSYDAPSEQWGMSSNVTLSASKENDEVIGKRLLGKLTRKADATKHISDAWHTIDVSGYYVYDDTVTVRLGVNNLFDANYIMWETLRQSATSAVHKQKPRNTSRFSAPGRNFTASLEMKF